MRASGCLQDRCQAPHVALGIDPALLEPAGWGGDTMGKLNHHVGDKN